jgi:hypothetical protein
MKNNRERTMSLRCILCAAIAWAVLIPVSSVAAPLKWRLSGYFPSGGRILGTFVYDEDTERYSDISVFTTPDFSYVGSWYSHYRPEVTPDPSFKVTFWESLPEDLIGVPAIIFSWIGPLSNAGGTAHYLSSPIEGLCGSINSAGNCLVRQSRIGFGTAISRELGVSIDVRPNDTNNSIPVKPKGLLPIAILSTSVAMGESVDFDATQVDPSSIAFGPNRASIKHSHGHIADIDNDGDGDLLIHVRIQQIGVECGDSRPVLRANSYSGLNLVGADWVTVENCD